MKIQRRFTKLGTDPLDTITWEKRESVIREPDGTVVFEMRDIEVPAFWSQVATDILAQKYFRKAGVPQPDGSLGRETTARQVVRRLAGCWTDWGRRYKYFDTDEDAAAFDAEITHMLIHQMAAPNSPQWFNTGLAYAYGITGPAQGHYFVDPDTKELTRAKDSYTHPQPHACLPYRALVATPDGPIAIGDIVTRDRRGLEVYDREGVTTVQEVKYNGVKSVYRVSFELDGYLEATDDHRVLAIDPKTDMPSWIAVSDLRPGMRVARRNDLDIDEVITRASFSTQDLPQPTNLVSRLRVDASQRISQQATLEWMVENKPKLSKTLYDEIISVDFVANEDVYDIQTASHSFLVNHYVVHNCFIQSVEDDLVNENGIMDLWVREARLFKYGSGTGTNFSNLRAEGEKLAGGGSSSGLMSFLKVGDRAAGAIKSGGTTRRAAKMVILDMDHPDIEKFINWKVQEEKKVAALMAAGYDSSYEGEAYQTVSGQNSNNSVRVSDKFIDAVRNDGSWDLLWRKDRSVARTVRARDLWDQIGRAAWACADPGVQYDDIINSWHTSPKGGKIKASNPCVTGDTLVATADGLKRIDSLVGKSAFVIGSDAKPHFVSNIFPTGTKPVFRLRTKAGFELRLTAEHKVLTADRGDVAACELVPGDRVQLNGSGFGNIELPDDVALGIGVAIGDGYLGHSVITGHNRENITLVMAADEAPILAKVASAVNDQKRLLKPLGSIGRNSDVSVTSYSPGTSRLAFASGPVVQLFKRYAVLDEGSDRKRFTPAVHELTEASVQLILRGLFTADGTVANYGAKSQYVSLDSTSSELLKQVQLLLLSFGIKSKLYSERRAGRLETELPDGKGSSKTYPVKEMHSLRISRSSRVGFEHAIGFDPDSAKAAALGALNCDVETYTDSMSDVVESLDPLGEEAVYDLTESDTSHFVANGIVVHNCSEYMFLDDTACFAPETRISTPNGLRKVADLFAAQEAGERILITTELHSEDDHRRVAAHRPAVVTKVGKRAVYRMTLKDGREIRATADHKFLTNTGEWKRVDELKPDQDRVQIRLTGDAVSYSSSPLDVKRWQMLGWLTGDGVFNKDTVALVFGPTELDTALEMTDEFNVLKAEAATGTDGSIRSIRQSVVSTQYNGVMQTSASQPSLVQHLQRRYGFKQGLATTKDVPSSIHHVAADLKVAYLQGLFSADGTMLENPSGSESQVMLASSSPQLMRSVQLLLSDIGIVSRVTWHHPEGRKNPQGQLHVYNQAARRFLTLVGFPCSTEKDAQAQHLLSRPFNAAKKNPRAPKVVDIVPDGEEVVYDITEPVTHSVIAEGLIAHNCNLASINLMTFFDTEKNTLDVEGYRHAIRLWTITLEISVLMAQFPGEEIARKSYEYRTLGLGYANLGTMLMVAGIPYDSSRALAISGAISAILTGESYATSAEMAGELGPFARYSENADDMLRVMRNHRRAAYNAPASEYEELSVVPMGIEPALCPPYLLAAARESWDKALELGEQDGYRNAQATCIAPTGTIGLLMDCDTTGIEPDFALVKFKKLAGGGYFKIINQSIPITLRNFGYTQPQIDDIVRYAKGSGTLYGSPYINAETLRARGFTDEDIAAIERTLPTVFEIAFGFNQWSLGEATLQRLGFTAEQYNAADFDLLRSLGFTREETDAANNYICGTMTIEGAPHLKEDHYAAFDCANKCGKIGRRFIQHMGHVRMMAAAQPFISGAISKTINMPNEATVQDIQEAYLRSWDLGLKSIALYRDGSKLSQPLSTKGSDKTSETAEDRQIALSKEFEERIAAARLSAADELRPDEILAAAQRILANTDNTDFKRKVAQVLERNRLPAKRRGWTQKAKIAGHTVFLRTGEYGDGTLGEIFVDLHKEGASFRSLMNCFAIAVSIGLQYGVPLEDLVEKFTFTRFEPNGFVDHPNVKSCTSVIDYIFRVLGMEYLGRTDFVQVKPEDKDVDETHHEDRALSEFETMVAEQQAAEETPQASAPKRPVKITRSLGTQPTVANMDPTVAARMNALRSREAQLASMMGDAPVCDGCGSLTRRNGACYVCDSCGRSMGCS
jgi:ribonucleotide reductase alpha subunit